MSGVFTIAACLPFADTLAAGLLAEAGGDPLALAACEVLLPNRRARRALSDAFLRLSEGRPLLLPRMRTIEAVDEEDLLLTAGDDDFLSIPPAIPALERRLLLARTIMALGAGRGGLPPTPDQAVRLAEDLAALLDAVAIERLSFDRLEALVEGDLARHWQETVRFLDILSKNWPDILAERGQIDPQERVNRLIDAQSAAWRRRPPDHPVIAAGSTGTRPATADLLAVVAGLERGRVVLPGLDGDLDEESWTRIEASHPQYGMKRLLERLDVPRARVRPFSAAADPRRGRVRLLSEALRPAETCEAWRDLPPFSAADLAGVSRLDAPGPREEAAAIALILRQTLETEGRRAALVTPDRDLARRVAAELERWGLAIDDSAGTPLATTEPGAFIRLVAAMVAEDFAPHATLALLKHPLAAGGERASTFRASARRLDRTALRGPRPAPGVAGLRLAAAGDPRLETWLDGLDRATAAFSALMAAATAPFADLVRAHMECAEALAAGDGLPGAARLWRGEAGQELADFAAELLAAAPALGAVAPARYPALFDAMLTGRAVRPAWGSHPRLFLWGPLEARLQQADVMVLGGLNEGIWPPLAETDPWMSRPMRADFGLTAPERRIGLAAHDFVQAFAAPVVVLTRAVRVDGTPTVPARWLLRLDAVMKAAGLSFAGQQAPAWLDWAAALDRPVAPGRDTPGRPAPRPPVAARPRRLSVTEIETWMRDPYAVYARHVLGLRELNPIDAEPGPADYGSLVHRVLERYFNGEIPPDPNRALARLLAIGEEVFADVLVRPSVRTFWWPRFQAVAAWVAAREGERRPRVARTLTEIDGALEIPAPAGPFRLHARADRLDILADGTLALIDYKTGAVPRPREIAAGFAPQLPLEAIIAVSGGFAPAPAAPVTELLFWQLKGGETGGKESSAGDDPLVLAEEALAGLVGLVAAFDDPETPYEARPHPDMAPRYSEVLHLARVKEWAAGDEGEGE